MKDIKGFQASTFAKSSIDHGSNIFQSMEKDNPSLIDIIHTDSVGENMRQEIRQLVLCLEGRLAKWGWGWFQFIIISSFLNRLWEMKAVLKSCTQASYFHKKMEISLVSCKDPWESYFDIWKFCLQIDSYLPNQSLAIRSWCNWDHYKHLAAQQICRDAASNVLLLDRKGVEVYPLVRIQSLGRGRWIDASVYLKI